MGLSGSYEHKDIDSNNNNNKKISEKVLRGVKTYSTPFDISSHGTQKRMKNKYAFNFNDFPALVFFVRWGSAFDTLIALYTT